MTFLGWRAVAQAVVNVLLLLPSLARGLLQWRRQRVTRRDVLIVIVIAGMDGKGRILPGWPCLTALAAPGRGLVGFSWVYSPRPIPRRLPAA